MRRRSKAGIEVNYQDPMLASFIDLLAEILVESLNQPDDSRDRVSGEAPASLLDVEEGGEGGTIASQRSIVRETTV
jgi:hypothetical protein